MVLCVLVDVGLRRLITQPVKSNGTDLQLTAEITFGAAQPYSRLEWNGNHYCQEDSDNDQHLMWVFQLQLITREYRMKVS